MSQDFLGEIHSTPLDVLLSAISGPGNGDGQPFQLDESQLQAQAQALQEDYSHASTSDQVRPPQSHDREALDLDSFLSQPEDNPVNIDSSLGGGGAREGQRVAVTEVIKEILLTRNVADSGETPPNVSSVSLWHPMTGQKSYGKERRLLNPPPTLFVSGPLAKTLTYASITTMIGYDKANGDSSIASSSMQAHRIPLATPESETDQPPPNKRTKVAAREFKERERATAAKLGFGTSLSMRAFQSAQKEREMLRDGLSFPTLIIPEAVGKEKEVALELVLGEPGQETSNPTDNLPIIDTSKQDEGDDSAAIDHAVLQEFFAQNGQSEPNQDVPRQGDLSAHSETAPSPWAVFRSTPLRVIAKPSQKTAKARSMLSCLSANDTVSLFTRIHGQTVRTKYMKLETEPRARLTAKSGKWTPFRFEIIEPGAPLPKPSRTRPPKDKVSDEQYRYSVLTYGSIVRLEDVQSGYKSEPVRLVRVDKNEAVVDGDIGQPVSELHRVGFVKLDVSADGQGRQYLSAPGARIGGAELEQSEARGSRRRPLPKTERTSPAAEGEAEESAPHTSLAEAEQAVVATSSAIDMPLLETKELGPGKKTKRRALARATIAEAKEGSTQAVLAWAAASVESREVSAEEEGKMMKRVAQVEKVPDWMCWVITGVACSSFSFFKAPSSHLSESNLSETEPLGRIPRMLEDPLVRHGELRPSFEFAVSEPSLFRSSDSHQPTYEVYLGPLGPLGVSFWRSSSGVGIPPAREDAPMAIPYDEEPTERDIYPHSAVHVSRSHIVVSSGTLPRYDTFQDLVKVVTPTLSEQTQAEESRPLVDSLQSAAEPWLGPDTDITGQETLNSSDFVLSDTLQSDAKNKVDSFGSDLIDPSLQSGPLDNDVALAPPERGEQPGGQISLPLFLARRSDGLVLSLDKAWQWVDVSASSQ